MPILFPILLTVATMTGPAAASRPHIASPSSAGAPLTAAVSAAAKREALSAPRELHGAARQFRQGTGRPHHSIATRATAIFAGAMLGSLAGIMAGASIGALGGEDGALAGMAYGMPIGAAVGGFLTARWVR